MTEIQYRIVTATIEQRVHSMRIRSKFKTLPEWLGNICEETNPPAKINEFCIELFFRQPANDYFICLYGVNTILDKKGQTRTCIVFEPANMYFKLNKKEYKGLGYTQIKEDLLRQMKEFFQTEKFKYSLLSKSNMTTNLDEELNWCTE